MENSAHAEPRDLDEDLIHHVGASGDYRAELV
jgi:hypothetical protein